MTSWFQEFLQNDVRFLLVGASVFIGLMVVSLLVIGLRKKRRGRRAERTRVDDPVMGEDASELMALETESHTPITAQPEAGFAEIVIAPSPPREDLSKQNASAKCRIRTIPPARRSVPCGSL